jgi:hypothetical protein
VAGPGLADYFFASVLVGASSFFASDEVGALPDGVPLDAAPEDDEGALLDDVAPEELAGGVDGEDVVAGGVEADGAVDLDADFDASSPHAARATAAAAIRSNFFIGYSS